MRPAPAPGSRQPAAAAQPMSGGTAPTAAPTQVLAADSTLSGVYTPAYSTMLAAPRPAVSALPCAARPRASPASSLYHWRHARWAARSSCGRRIYSWTVPGAWLRGKRVKPVQARPAVATLRLCGGLRGTWTAAQWRCCSCQPTRAWLMHEQQAEAASSHVLQSALGRSTRTGSSRFSPLSLPRALPR